MSNNYHILDEIFATIINMHNQISTGDLVFIFCINPSIISHIKLRTVVIVYTKTLPPVSINRF